MKKKAYVKNQIRNIFKTKARFFSIFIIVCLGAGCFAGLRSSPSIMRKSADSYLNEYGYNDIQYIGTLAFNDSNIKDIESIKGVKEVDYGNRFDATVSYKKKNISGEPTAVVFTSDFKTNVNKPNIQSGRIPKTDDECLLDHHYAMMHDLNIGDNINVKSSYGKKTFKVVGLSDDVRYYVKFDRGTSSIGDGSCALFVLIKNTGNESLALPSSLYDLKSDKILYNNVRVVLDNPSNYNIFSKEYEKYVASINKKIKKKLKNSYSNDYSTLTNQANEKIDEATSKYQKGYDDYNNGLNQYNEGINTYNTNLKLYQDGLKKYQEGYNTYTKNEAIYNSSLTKYQEGLTAYNNSLTSYNQLLEALSFIDNYTSSYQTAKTNLPSLEAAYNLNPSPTLLNQINQLKQLINSYETIENQLINQAGSISNARVLASTTKTSLDDAKKTLEENSSKLSLAKEQLDKASLTLSSTKKTLEDSSVQLANARTTLNSTKEQLANAKSSLDDANTQIQEAKSEIKDIPKGKIISLTSKQDSSIISFDMNADSIDSLSILFPTIFFLVAALVSMTTMTRMVEEYRLQSGTLRSLGYSKKDVIRQYILYAFLATFLASVLGVIWGVCLLPSIIYYLYSYMMFTFKHGALITFYPSITLLTIGLSVGLVVLVTYIVCRKELQSNPATLIRPKPPKNGKRIILEKINFIWSHLSFIQKVSMRNIFRYKKRFLMSIIGIAGCSGLIITAFGIKGSVASLANLQYKVINHYDGSVSYDSNLSQKQIETLNTNLINNEGDIKETMLYYSKTISVEDGKYGQITIPESTKKLSKYTSLKEYGTNKKLTLSNNGVIINEKLAELLDKGVGDSLTITIDNTNYQVRISGVATFYFQHYIYMTNDYYARITGSIVNYDAAYYHYNKDSNKKVINRLEQYIKSTNGIDNCEDLSNISTTFDSMMSSLNSIVVILIAMAGLLNFVVLYNLTNINIQERKSEIATIKVLGFYNKEVYDYVFRENYILAIIGSLVGGLFGTFLHRYIIINVEIEQAMFLRYVEPSIYILAFVITLLFTFLINLYMRRVLRKIDMVESLKSIE